MKKIITVTLATMLSCSNALATEDKEPEFVPKKGDVYFSVIPIIAVNPTFGTLYGVAASVSGYAGNPETSRLSTSLGTLTYSTKDQLLFTYKSNVYLEDDSWIMLGDWRFFDTSQSTYGLGTGDVDAKFKNFTPSVYPEDEQNIEFNYIRLHETAFKRVVKNTYIGVGYHFDRHYNTIEKEPDPTSHQDYSDKRNLPKDDYTLSGASLNMMYDSRDNAANPYEGRYGLATLRYNPEFLGSSKESSTLWLEYRDYFNLSGEETPKHLLAIWTYANVVTSGETPYMDLPAVGWDQFGRSGRAYTQGRFRGEKLLYGEVEYRGHIWKNLGGVVFANATTASSEDADIDLFDSNDYAYGLGLRYMLDKRARTNVSLDYAWGKYGENALYLNLNETF